MPPQVPPGGLATPFPPPTAFVPPGGYGPGVPPRSGPPPVPAERQWAASSGGSPSATSMGPVANDLDADPDASTWSPEDAEDGPWSDDPNVPERPWAPAIDGQDRPWDEDADARDDMAQARMATDPDQLETVSPDDPEWTYASAGDDDEVIAEPAQGTDWLDRICPYLLSEGGTSRSSQPDERHRCTAQDPPATLPLAFQERFCLTERHVRCEMYKVAEDARTQAFVDDSIPAEQVRSARFRPTVRSRPVTLEPATAIVANPPDNDGPNRQVLIALGAAGGFALILLVIAILLGGGGGNPGGLVPTPAGEPVATVGPDRTTGPEPTLGGGPAATQAPVVTGPPILIRYELQEGDRLVSIAETFGTSRLAITRANDEAGIEENPRDARVGDVIIVPVSPDMSEAEIQNFPGFVEFVES